MRRLYFFILTCLVLIFPRIAGATVLDNISLTGAAKLREIVTKHVQARLVYEGAMLRQAEIEIKKEKEALAKDKANIKALVDELIEELNTQDEDEEVED